MAHASPVEPGAPAVEAEAHPNAFGGQPVQDRAGEQGAVGLNGRRHLAVGGDGEADGPDLLQKWLGARQQGFAAVQFQPDALQAVGVGVLTDPLGGAGHGLRRHPDRALPPALVGAAVDVAVGTSEVAPAVHLDHELPQRDRGQPGTAQGPVRPQGQSVRCHGASS